MMNLATVSKTELDGGYCIAVCEVMGDADDTARGDVMTLPGIESRPLKGAKVLAFVSPNGDHFFFGIPLATAIDEGSLRLYWTDANGTEKGHMLGKPDGTFEIDTTGAITVKSGSTITVEGTGLVTVKSAAQVTVQAPKIALVGSAGEGIDALFKIFTSFISATAGGFPLTNVADSTTAAAVFAGMKQ